MLMIDFDLESRRCDEIYLGSLEGRVSSLCRSGSVAIGGDLKGVLTLRP